MLSTQHRRVWLPEQKKRPKVGSCPKLEVFQLLKQHALSTVANLSCLFILSKSRHFEKKMFQMLAKSHISPEGGPD